MPEKTTLKEHGKKNVPPTEKEVQPEVVIQIPLAELHPFPDHPFQVRDDDSMRETAESVKAYCARLRWCGACGFFPASAAPAQIRIVR